MSGTSFITLGGSEAVGNFGNPAKEKMILRESAAVSDFSFVKKFRYDEDSGADFLDSVLPANMLKLRYGMALETFLADSSGRVVADVEAINVDGGIYLLCESLEESGLLSGGEDMANSLSALSVDGPLAWKVAKEVFGSDIMNLSYFSAETYKYKGEDCVLVRDGRTGEFGYKFLLPVSVSGDLKSELAEIAEACGGGMCGFEAHACARMESGFFNVYAEGAMVRNPLELGLQWMMDFSKDSFSGSDFILKNRKEGYKRKLLCLKRENRFSVGEKIFDGTEPVGEVVAEARSELLNSGIALALTDLKYACSGFDFSGAKSVSRPLVVTKSMTRGMEG